MLPESVKIIYSQMLFESGVEYIIVENPTMETGEDAFLRADNIKIFLTYNDITDKEMIWKQYVSGVYSKNDWEYDNGIPVIKKN